MIPPWLAQRLQADNPDGVHRGAIHTHCRRCHTPVLRGLDADLCALPVTLTAAEIDPFGEYLALARGLLTYTLARRMTAAGTPRWEIDPRYPTHIRNQRRAHPVMAEHRCGLHLPAHSNGILTQLRPTISAPTDAIPF